jgi:hypothetical protein
VVTLHNGHDFDVIHTHGGALVRALAELERVLRSFGPDRGELTKVAIVTLLDGLSDADPAAE